MKWAWRLGIAGIIWAIVTFAWVAPHDCATNDLCGLGFALLNVPTIVFGDGLPAAGMFLLFAAILADGSAGFLIGWLIDFIFLKPKAKPNPRDFLSNNHLPGYMRIDAVDRVIEANTVDNKHSHSQPDTSSMKQTISEDDSLAQF